MIKKLILTISALSISLTACHKQSSDAVIRQKTVGTWSLGALSGTMTFSKNGDFTSKWTRIRQNVSSELTYDGIWKIENGFLVMVITNATGPEPREPVGFTNHLKVISINQNQMVYQSNSYTNQMIISRVD